MSQNSLLSSESNSSLSCSDYKIVVLGIASVGKSCISIRFVHNTFSPNYDPTLQNTFRKNINLDSKPGSLGYFT